VLVQCIGERRGWADNLYSSGSFNMDANKKMLTFTAGGDYGNTGNGAFFDNIFIKNLQKQIKQYCSIIVNISPHNNQRIYSEYLINYITKHFKEEVRIAGDLMVAHSVAQSYCVEFNKKNWGYGGSVSRLITIVINFNKIY